MSEQQQAHPTTTESELIAVRRDKLAKIRELGIGQREVDVGQHIEDHELIKGDRIR